MCECRGYDSYLGRECTQKKNQKKKLDTDTQTAIFKQSWRQEADFDFSDFCSAEIVFGSGRKHWEISLPGQLEV